MRGRIEVAALASAALSAIGCSAQPVHQEIPIVAITLPAASSGSTPQAPLEAETAAPKPEAPRAIAWEHSEPKARERARKEGRPMIVYLHADWAVTAIRMERDVWSDPRVVQEARGFVAVKIDVTNEDPDADLSAARYEMNTMPSTVVLDARGERVATLNGAADKEAVIAALKRASE